MKNQQIVEERPIWGDITLIEETGEAEKLPGLRFEAVVARADEVNQNGRLYPKAVLERAFARLNERPSRYPGAVDHPDPKRAVKAGELGIAWESFRWEGSDVIGIGRTIETTNGKDLRAVIESKVEIGFSTRGSGKLKEETDPASGKKFNRVVELDLRTADAVTDPSVADARVNLNFVREDTEKVDETQEKLFEAFKAQVKAEGDLIVANALLAAANSRLEKVDAEIAAANQARTVAEERATKAEAELTEQRKANADTALRAAVVEAVGSHKLAAAIVEKTLKFKGLNEENLTSVVELSTGAVEAIASRANGEEAAGKGKFVSEEKETKTEKVEEAKVYDPAVAQLAEAAGL